MAGTNELGQWFLESFEGHSENVMPKSIKLSMSRVGIQIKLFLKKIFFHMIPSVKSSEKY